MRKLSPNERKDIESTLLAAFPTEADLDRAVKYALEENLQAIAGRGPLNDVVFHLVNWAEDHDKIIKLISGAHKENSDNQALQALALRLGSFAGDSARNLSPVESKIRTKYLEVLQEDIQERLKVSIHNARFIDIGVVEDPFATHLPWTYHAPDSPEEFTDFTQAFEHYQRRLLLLGAPGSGKSTVLLHIARKLLQEALENPQSPIPLLLNLTQFSNRPMQSGSRWFQWRTSNQSAEPAEVSDVDHWLAQMMSEKYPFIDRKLADSWVKEGRIAALLDGLDEVASEQRSELVELLNKSYLDRYPFAIVAICSRLIEYHVLRSNSVEQPKDTEIGLHLEAVTLQPLTPEQIADYLEKAQATALGNALIADVALQELAQTPLTLSMMTIAYAGLAPTDIGAEQNLSERRRHLFNSYVNRMMQRKARRDAGIPFDLDPRKDRPTEYSRKQVDRALGWLAVRMSERAQTVIPPNSLYSFLKQKTIVKGKNSTIQLIWLTDAIVVCLFLILSGLLLVPFSLTQLSILCLLGISTGFLYWLSQNAFADSNDSSTAETEATTTKKKLRQYALPTLSILGLVAIMIVTVGSIIVTLDSILPWNIPPLSLSIIVTIFIITTTVLTIGFRESRKRNIYILLTLSSIVAPLLFVLISGATNNVWGITATSMAICQLLSSLTGVRWDNTWKKIEWGQINRAFAVYGGLLLMEWVGIWFVDSLAWYEVVTLVSAAILSASEAPSIMLAIVILTLIASLFGMSFVVLAWAGIGFLSLLISVNSKSGRFKELQQTMATRYKSVDEPIAKILEAYLFTPVLRFLLKIRRILPWNSQPFFNYLSEIHLLKLVGSEQEFLHRLLRDYFATHELIPSLSTDDPEKIIELIKQLSLQGESALETLSDLARHPQNVRIRQAAVIGASYIATPNTLALLESCLADPSKIIRLAVVNSTTRLTDDGKKRILEKAKNDTDLNVSLLVCKHAGVSIDIFADVAQLPQKYEDLLKELINSLDSEDDDIRMSAAWGLGEIRDSSLLIHLKKKIEDANVHVRATVAEAMGKISDTSIVPTLIQAITDPIPLMRIHVARALGQVGDASSVPALLQALRDSNSNVRSAAVSALGQVVDASSVPVLLQALRDSESDVRRAATSALGQVVDASMVPLLLQALADSDSDVRSASASALGRVGDANTVPVLLQALRDSDGNVRSAAASSLGQLGDAGTVPALLQALRDSYPLVRSASASALGQLGDAGTVPALLQALRDSYPFVRRAAASALGQVGDAGTVPTLVEALRDSESFVCSAAALALSQVVDASSFPVLLQALRNSNRDVRCAATRVLGQVGDASTVPALLQVLRDSYHFVRGAAANALGQVGDASTVPALLQALRDSESFVRSAAASALGQVVDASSVPALLQALTDSESFVRSAAASALGQVGDTSSVPALLQALRDSDGDVRSAAASALGRVGDASTVPVLLQALRDSDGDVRSAAASALGRVGDASTVPVLLQALRDSDGDVRSAVASALGRVGDASSVPALQQALRDSDWNVRSAAASALEQVGDASTIPTLQQVLRDSDWRVRTAAASALGRVGDTSTVPALLRAIRDSDWNVRTAAASALGQAGDASSVPALLQALGDSKSLVRSAAASALGQVGDASSVPALLQALRDSDWNVRHAAASALGSIGDKRAIQGLVARLRDRAVVGDKGKRVCDFAAEALARIGTPEAIQALTEWNLRKKQNVRKTEKIDDKEQTNRRAS